MWCLLFGIAYCWVNQGCLWKISECYQSVEMSWKLNNSPSQNTADWINLLACQLPFVPGRISFLLLTWSFLLADANLPAHCPSQWSWLDWMKTLRQGKPPVALSLLPWDPLPPQPCAGPGACLSHLDSWVSLLGAPLTQLFSSRASFMPHERDFIKQGSDHIPYFPKSHK